MIELNRDVIAEACQLIGRLGLGNSLRTLDSLQLAYAMRSGAEGFMCHDVRLRELARQVGLNVVEI